MFRFSSIDNVGRGPSSGGLGSTHYVCMSDRLTYVQRSHVFIAQILSRGLLAASCRTGECEVLIILRL